jgi:chromosome segregation ATPase
MAVDSNFAKLEEEVNRLLDLLGRLKKDNADLQSQVEGLRTENAELKGLSQRLQQAEHEVLKNREKVKSRIEGLLSRLDGIHS